MRGKYPKNPLVGGCTQLLSWGASPAGQGTAGNTCTSPFPVAAGKFNTCFGFSFPGIHWPGVWRDQNQGKRPLEPCFSQLQTSNLSLCLHTSVIPLLPQLGSHSRGCFSHPIPCPFLPLRLWVQWGLSGAPGEWFGWAGGCEEEEEEAVLPLQTDSHGWAQPEGQQNLWGWGDAASAN